MKSKKMKNKKITLLILPFLFLACTNQKTENKNCVTYDSGFSICQDTIFVDIKGEMTHALKYQDKFYVLFKQRVLKYGGYEKRWLYIFSNGKIENVIDCPEEMKTFYLDFFVKNDSIILKPYMNKKIYFLDLQGFTWNKIDKADDLIFEDEKFYVYSLDFGEWGGKTWFKDKKTGIEYAVEATTPLVNKIDTIYYLTNGMMVTEIKNPLKLNKCDDDVTYENIKKSGKSYSWYGEPIGFDVIYADLDTLSFDNYTFTIPREINIVSSFVWQNKLLHIYKTDTAAYVAKIENNSIKTIQKIGDNLSFYRKHYSYRCRNLKGNNELLQFDTENEQLFGLMEMIDNKIFVHYFVNKAELEPKSIGTEKADSIFLNRFNLILSDLGELKFTDVELQEQKWGTFDISPIHVIELRDFWKSYLIREDTLISNSIIYHVTKTSDLIRRVSFEWETTNHSRFDLDKLISETFAAKLNFLKTFLCQKFGPPVSVRKEKNKYPVTIWQAPNGVKIEMIGIKNFNWIRLEIIKN